VTPTNAVAVLFTSGSTGTPKGIVHEHASFCAAIRDYDARLGMGAGARVLQFAAYTFDVSNNDMLITLASGGCVCVPSEHARVNDLAGAMRALRVNTACLTPTVADMLDPATVPELRTLALGGEAVSRSVLAKWAGRLRLVNLYGPAEAACWCSSRDLRADDDPANIGIAGSGRCWVVDPGIAGDGDDGYLRLAPIGAIGELLIEGPHLARGYMGDAERTAASFVENPAWRGRHRSSAATASSSVTRMYKTGDLVRYNLDGTLSFVGRKDTQIKLHGQRIELSEVEHHLRRCFPAHKSVAEIVALPTSDAGAAPRPSLIAFISYDAEVTAAACNGDAGDDKLHPAAATNGVKAGKDVNTAPSLAALSPRQRVDFLAAAARAQAGLAEALPPYMVPSLFLPVSRLPLSLSGKIDRRALRGLAAAPPPEMLTRYRALAATGASTDVVPDDGAAVTPAASTAMEVRLRRLWARVLGLVEPAVIGAHDDFLALGGDSVSAMRLVWAARAEGMALTVGDVFRTPTLAQMASLVGAVAAHAAAQDAAGGAHDDRESARQAVVLAPRADLLRHELHSLAGALPRYAKAARPQPLLRGTLNGDGGGGGGDVTVFVTGATGYVGTQILRQLLHRPAVARVVVHVRAESPAHGLQRVVETARAAQWWSDALLPKIEIWPGDLTRPRLGLSDAQWTQLAGKDRSSVSTSSTGSGSNRITYVDAIIDNAAVVHWHASYERLRASNVIPTVELLRAAAASPAAPRLVYVSGGHLSGITVAADVDGSDDAMTSAVADAGATQLADADGYTQSKWMSETLVAHCARTWGGDGSSYGNSSDGGRLCAVRPGFVIGTAAEGVPNVDDFIWRVLAAAVRVGAYCADDAAQWVYVAGADSVAAAIVDNALGTLPLEPARETAAVSACGPSVLRVCAGMAVGDVWRILTDELGYRLRPAARADWLRMVRSDVEAAKDSHPLLPVLPWLESAFSALGNPPPPPEDACAAAAEAVKAAMQKNIESLIRVGYLPPPNATEALLSHDGRVVVPKRVNEAAVSVFERSQRRLEA
jgi:amino acid adenylation domain-containing protein/thioester reductase-like protein